jgi:FAD/FMN-containing dehydrogenase
LKSIKIDLTPEEEKKVRAICKIFNAQSITVTPRTPNTSQQSSKESSKI